MSDRAPRVASVAELMTGLVASSGELLSAHVAVVRHELNDGLDDLRVYTRAVIYQTAAMIVAAIAVNVALVVSLIALGVPTWVAAWLVAAGAIAVLVVMVRRAHASTGAGRATGAPGAALARAGEDAAWLADRATDVIS